MSSILDKTTDLLLHLPPAMDRRSSGPSSDGSGMPDFSSLQNQVTLPLEFTWPKNDLAETEQRPHELKEPVVDLKGFMDGDKVATARAVELVRVACSTHGFFQVTNHGIDRNLIGAAYDAVESVFRLPWNKKMSIKRKVGSFCGFSGGHADRYSSKLPWKETFSFGYSYSRPRSVTDYFHSVLGPDFEHAGVVYEKYCEAVKELSHVIMELLALSLGVDRMHYRKFFEDGSSIMRCNYYPPCSQSSLTLGTGPHTDPTSITILHQDQVGGLQVFSGGSWLNIRPRPDSFVINIGDTFAALSNGRCKSCLHRAVVNRSLERRSLVFFVCPREDKVVKPPPELAGGQARKYPDFRWSDLLDFTQNHYRADVSTLDHFFHWLRSSPKAII
ncbi:hypothetical protein SAY86_031211 [Trapa natans]|uniref:Fe2OG dioxygenase domain-containing protein n=1 Tax=Trapa natans TaxID=22666 RepID=A0AAN7LLJ2_TRANT|nr:hypothetical protein SAY86_031211 [Trapa natans]